MIERSRWLLAIACGCALAVLLEQYGSADPTSETAAGTAPDTVPPDTVSLFSAEPSMAIDSDRLVVQRSSDPGIQRNNKPGNATAKRAKPAVPRVEFDAAIERLQSIDSGTTDLSLANAIEAVWRTALDAQTPQEALPLIADWLTHADPIVAEGAAAAVASLRLAQQPVTEAATPPTLGHERLRDLALNSPDAAVRREAILELTLLTNPEASRWLAVAAELDIDPANQTLLRQLNRK